MKKAVFLIALASLFVVSCDSSRLLTYKDDVYSDPVEEKKLLLAKQASDRKKQEEEKKQKEAALLAQQEKDNANPYYQEPHYESDDYYDYEYASRLKRFHNPVYGTGYYDNYYTDSYWYNQNPSYCGNSIYSSYNWWMPSTQFGYYSNGFYTGIGNNYPYNNGYYNPYFNQFNYGYQPNYYYGSPWYNPYYYNGYSPYYSGNNWGYYNSLDKNSNYTYAPRKGAIGGNSPRSSYAGMPVPKESQSYRQNFIRSVADKQEDTPKFTELQKSEKVINRNNNSFPSSNSNLNTVTETNGNTSPKSTRKNNWFNSSNNSAGQSRNKSTEKSPTYKSEP
ncbi:MAG: hypothetical protein AB7O73_09675, partial [Bacteroidia bacterium]